MELLGPLHQSYIAIDNHQDLILLYKRVFEFKYNISDIPEVDLIPRVVGVT
jgi:hypothetical protein